MTSEMFTCPHVSLTELLSFVVDNRGKTVPTAESGHVLIATNCIKNEALYPVFEKVRYLSNETYKTWFRSHPQPGDIIFVNKGTPGRVCMVPDPVNFCIAQDMIALRVDDSKIYNKYLFAVLRGREIQTQIYNTNVGDVIPHFKKSFLDQLLIPLPSMEIQRGIGDMYFDLSEKADNNTKINHHLEQMVHAIFKSWFVDFEPFGGKMPSDWREAELGDVTTIRAGGDKPTICSPTPTDECSVPVYSNGIDKFGLYGYTDRPKVTEESVTVSARGTIGFVCLRQDPFVPIVRLVTVIPNKTFITSKYLYLYLCSIHIAGVGTTQQQLTVPDFKKYRILVPNITVVKDFTQTVTSMFDTIRQKREENAKIAALRDALLPRLLSGELPVANI